MLSFEQESTAKEAFNTKIMSEITLVKESVSDLKQVLEEIRANTELNYNTSSNETIPLEGYRTSRKPSVILRHKFKNNSNSSSSLNKTQSSGAGSIKKSVKFDMGTTTVCLKEEILSQLQKGKFDDMLNSTIELSDSIVNDSNVNDSIINEEDVSFSVLDDIF